MEKLVFSAVIFLAAVGGSLADYDCRAREGEKCDKSLLPRKYPATKEEFDSDCQNLQTFFDCTTEVLEKCGPEDEASHMERVLFYIRRRACNPESHIYEALTSDPLCIGKAIKKVGDVFCPDREGQEKAVEIFRENLQENLDEKEEHCLNAMFRVACNAVYMGEECGIAVGDAFLDISNNVDYDLQVVCTHELLSHLPRIVNTFRSVAEAQEEKNILDSK